MRRILLAFLLVALCVVTTPTAVSLEPGWDPQTLARWVGCRNVTFGSYDDDFPNAFMALEGDDNGNVHVLIAFSTGLQEQMPPDEQFFVLLHELGHCIQWQDGRLYQMASADLEQEADVLAATWMCNLGYDGTAVAEQTFRHLAQIANRDIDEPEITHGSIRDRINQVSLRTHSCLPNRQYPILALSTH
jgi:hypothetical protein